MDRESACDDGGRDLDQPVRQDPGDRHRPRRLRCGVPEQEAGRECQQETTHPCGQDCQWNCEREGEHVMAEDRDGGEGSGVLARSLDQARQHRLHHRAGNRPCKSSYKAGARADRQPGGGDRKRDATMPEQAKQAWAMHERGPQRRSGALDRLPQPDLTSQQRLARETVEAHAQQDSREHDHQAREAPEKLGAAEQDEGRLHLEHDRHGQDDERRHHVGRAHGAGVEADDHGSGHHRRDLADCR